MKKLGLLLTLQILLSCVYCQNTTLRPTITNNGYCFDSTQIREIARLSVHESINEDIIDNQDKSINNLKAQINNCNQVVLHQDSLIVIKDSTISLHKSILSDSKKICEADKEILKETHRKRTKKLFIVILIESIFLLGVLIVK